MKQEMIKEEITFREDDLKEFMALSYEEQLNDYFLKKKLSCSTSITIRYENSPKYLALERVEGRIRFSGCAFFLKHTVIKKFLYNKETKRVRSFYDRVNLMEDLCSLPRFNWLDNELKKGNIHQRVFSNSVVRDILAGKLTNCEDIVKTYLKSLKLKNISWKAYVQYLNGKTYFEMPINWIKICTTDINSSLILLSKDGSKSRLFRDMLPQALTLQKEINPRWSEKRMTKEHLEMTRILLAKEIEAKEETPVYDKLPSTNYDCQLLNSEKSVFMEAQEMHHCIHSCYWSPIKNHEYIAFSFYLPERFTLGLRATPAGFEFDQAYLKYDQKISECSDLTIDAFLKDSSIRSYLNQMHQKYYKPKPKSTPNLRQINDDLPI